MKKSSYFMLLGWISVIFEGISVALFKVFPKAFFPLINDNPFNFLVWCFFWIAISCFSISFFYNWKRILVNKNKEVKKNDKIK